MKEEVVKKLLSYLLALSLMSQFTFVGVARAAVQNIGAVKNLAQSENSEANLTNESQTNDDFETLPQVKDVDNQPTLPKVKDVPIKSITASTQPTRTISSTLPVKASSSQIQPQVVSWVGSILIDGGATYATDINREVVLTISGSRNDVTPDEMRFSNDDIHFSVFEAYSTTRNWTLAAGTDGPRIVYVQFRTFISSGYSYSPHYSATVFLDITTPQISQITFNPSSALLGIGGQIQITITAENLEAGLTANGSFNGQTLSWTDNGDGTYSATYTVLASDFSADNVEILDATLIDPAGNISDVGQSSGNNLDIDTVLPEISNIILTPNTVKGNGSQPVLITAEITDNISIGSVNIDLTAVDSGLGISSLYDDGTNGDQTAGDNIYSLVFYPNLINNTNQIYSLTINILDSANNLSQSTADLTIEDNVPPQAPQNLLAISGEGYISLYWADDLDAAYYMIYRSGSPFKWIADTTDNFYKDTSVIGGKTYIYKIIAFDLAGNKSNEVTISATPKLIIIAPDMPASVTRVGTETQQPQIASAVVETKPAPAVAEPTPTPLEDEGTVEGEKTTEEAPTNWPLIIGIILAALVIAFWVYYWYVGWQENKKASSRKK